MDDPELLGCSKCRRLAMYHGAHTFPPIESMSVRKDTEWVCEWCREDPLRPGTEDCHGCGKPIHNVTTRIECEDCGGYYHKKCINVNSSKKKKEGDAKKCRFCRNLVRK